MLLYFILGILFISLGIPLLENIQSIISAWTEYIVYILAYKVVDIKSQIEKQKEEEQQEEQFQIGFHQTEVKELKANDQS